MPAVLRQISEAFQNAKGETVKPKALIKWCCVCGFEGATFGDIVDGKQEWWCGWRDNRPLCINRGKL